MSSKLFSTTAIVIIWLALTIRVSTAAPNIPNNRDGFLEAPDLRVNMSTTPHHTTSSPYMSGSKPPLVQMANWHNPQQKTGMGTVSRTKRYSPCEDTENPCNCCCIDCWEYGGIDMDPIDKCYEHCNTQFKKCDCTKKRSFDYVDQSA